MNAVPAIAADPDDLEPIVILDDDLELAAPAASPPASLPARHAPPMLSQEAQDYLRSQGITDPATWAAFRIDAVADADLVRLLTQRQRGHVSPNGLWLPTFDPRNPERITGLIRQVMAYHHNTFMSAPVGIAGDPALDGMPRVVLTDSPIQALRLHARGVRDIALVEDPAVIPPLLDWFANREVVIAGFRLASRAAMKAALGPHGDGVLDLTLLPELDRSPAASLAALGINRPVEDAPPVTPHLLRDLYTYAVSRVVSGAGTSALRSLGVDNPSFINAYGIGYLPADVRSALSTEQRKALAGRIYPDAVVVPAYDEQGVIVDMLVLATAGRHRPIPSVHERPCGLIAPNVTTSYDVVMVVDSLRAAAEQFVGARQRVLLLRGAADAQANAGRIFANGVRRVVIRCRQDADAIASALQAAGIAVVESLAAPPPVVVTPPAEITLARHDQRTEQAVFTAGDLTYTADVPQDDQAQVGISVKRGDQEHPDSLDLGSEPQRRNFAASAAIRTGAPAAAIAGHVAQINAAIRSMAEQASAPPARAMSSAGTMGDAQRDAALALAQSPDLLARVVADLEVLAWTGEEANKRLVILAAMSRLLDDPVWVALSGSSNLLPGGAATIAAITPPEAVIHVSRLTSSAFFHADPSALRHKLLVIDDGGTLSTGVVTALKVLKRRGALSASKVERDPVRGNIHTAFVEVHGPVAVLAATDGMMDAQLQPHFVEVAGDESPDHVAEMLAAQRRRCTHAGNGGDRERVVARLQNLQRMLEAYPVIIPYAERIAGFGTSAIARRDHDLLLALLSSHALLYQHQRQVLDGAVVATEADFAVAAALMEERRAAADASLGHHARRLLVAVRSAGVSSFTMEDLGRLLPDWGRHTFRAGLDELVACDYLGSPRSGRGAARTYHLYAAASTPGAALHRRYHLLQVGELAKVGETDFANLTKDGTNG